MNATPLTHSVKPKLQVIICTPRQEARRMQDELIFLLSMNIIGLFLIDYFEKHTFAVECVWAIINTTITMYVYYKKKRDEY